MLVKVRFKRLYQRYNLLIKRLHISVQSIEFWSPPIGVYGICAVVSDVAINASFSDALQWTGSERVERRLVEAEGDNMIGDGASMRLKHEDDGGARDKNKNERLSSRL